MSSKNSLLEKIEEKQDKNLVSTNKPLSECMSVKRKPMNVISIFGILVALFIFFAFAVISIFTIYHVFNTNIIAGVSIKGLDVSGLSPSDAKYQIDNFINDFSFSNGYFFWYKIRF